MGLKEDYQKRIRKKEEEIAERELQIREARAYIQALVDSIKLLPRDSSEPVLQYSLRPGSGLFRAREAIVKHGKPLHVSELLTELSLPNDKKHRVSLSGTLSSYARKGKIFSKPSPNTFGLLEMGHTQEPPPEFGLDEAEKTEDDAAAAADEEGVEDIPF